MIKCGNSKICDICQAEFTATTSRQLRCSPACRKAGELRVAHERHLRIYADQKNDPLYRESNRIKMIGHNQATRQEKNEKARKYRAENREKLRVYFNEKRASDPIHRLCANMRARMWSAIKKQEVGTRSRSAVLLGASGVEFMKYLLSHPECQPEFSHENYGKVWSVDHIIPLAAFDLSNPQQQAKAFHHSNCRPLSAAVNSSKGALFNGVRHRHKREAV